MTAANRGFPPPPPSAPAPAARPCRLPQTSVRVLCEGLARLGPVPGKTAADYVPALYRTFYPHSVGAGAARQRPPPASRLLAARAP